MMIKVLHIDLSKLYFLICYRNIRSTAVYIIGPDSTCTIACYNMEY